MASQGSSGVALTRALLAVGAALTGATAWLVLSARPRSAGALAGAAGVALLAAGYRASHGGDRFERLADPILDRCFDGAVFGAIAWAARGSSPGVEAGALAALGASFLSSYVRAKGASLGYDLEERAAPRGLRYLLVGLGLSAGWLGWTVWAAAGTSAAAALIRTSQVVKEERA